MIRQLLHKLATKVAELTEPGLELTAAQLNEIRRTGGLVDEGPSLPSFDGLTRPGQIIEVDRPALLREWKKGRANGDFPSRAEAAEEYERRRVTPEEYQAAPKRIDRAAYPHLAHAFDNERKPPEAAGSATDDVKAGAVALADAIAARTDPAIEAPARVDVDQAIADVRKDVERHMGKGEFQRNAEQRGDKRDVRRWCRHCGWVGGGPRSKTCGGCGRGGLKKQQLARP